jgi:hypothetical protein
MLHALPPSEDQLRHVWADRDADPSGTFVVMADQRTLDWVVFRVQGHALQPFVRLRNRDIPFTVDRILRLGQDSFVLASSRMASEEGGKSTNCCYVDPSVSLQPLAFGKLPGEIWAYHHATRTIVLAERCGNPFLRTLRAYRIASDLTLHYLGVVGPADPLKVVVFGSKRE